MTAVLAASGLRKAFDGAPALVDGRLELHAGRIVGLVGENGAGKSTLVRILAGAVRPDAGELLLDGRPFRPSRPRDALDRGIQLVHQELMLVDDATIAENLHLGREPTRHGWLDRRRMRAAAERVLATLGMARDPDERVAGLPLGERQLVEVGRALIGELRVLALDEPTAALTEVEAERLCAIVGDLRRRGVAIVWISHRLDELERLCDTITTMRDGAHVRTAPIGEYPRAEVLRDLVGRAPADSSRPARSALRGGPVLELRGLGRRARCAGADFVLHEGEILGLFGLVGSGRTALAQRLVGLQPPEPGRVLLRGEDYRPRHPRDALRQGVAMATEDRKGLGLLLDRPIVDNVTLAALPAFSPGGFVRRRAETACAERLCTELSVRSRALTAPVRTLSGGNQQKVLLARLFATAADVWIVDEPTRGVDVRAKAEIHAQLERAVAAGRSILMISSDLPELLAVADRILVMRDGAIAGELDRASASAETVIALATGAGAVRC